MDQFMAINGTLGASKAANKSGENPAAQSFELCKLRETDSAIMNRVEGFITLNSKEDLVDKAVIELMYLNGLRISEVLNIDSKDIMMNGLIKVNALKGSWNRLCISKLYNDFWVKSVKKGYKLSETRTRYYYHRLLIKKGIYYKETQEEKRITTHVFRHLYIRIAKANNMSLEEVQQLIGHKNIKSTNHYYNEKAKRD